MFYLIINYQYSLSYYLNMDQKTEKPFLTPVESDNDVIAEILLLNSYSFKQSEKYTGNDEINCTICSKPLRGEYVLQGSCPETHIYHRNCILNQILVKKKFMCDACPNGSGEFSNKRY